MIPVLTPYITNMGSTRESEALEMSAKLADTGLKHGEDFVWYFAVRDASPRCVYFQFASYDAQVAASFIISEEQWQNDTN